MRWIFGLAILGWLAPTAAVAQTDGPEWEAQRCIWRCLAESPGAASRQYNDCVARMCSGEPARAPAPPAPTGTGRVWFAARTGDGQGNLAGIADQSTGTAFDLICGRDGRRNLALFGPEGPAAVLTILIDGRRFERPFVPHAGGITPRSPRMRPKSPRYGQDAS